MNTFTKFSAAVGTAGVSLAFFATTAAFADTTTATNTGNNVQVNAGSSSQTSAVVVNRNEATVTQTADTHVTTGNNTANRNIGGTSIQSGNAGVSNVLGAEANANTNAISVSGNQSNDESKLVNTGNNVRFNAGSNNTTVAAVTNLNQANVRQTANSRVNTGGNTANRNIGETDVQSGSAAVHNALGVQANKNNTLIDLQGAGNGGDSLTLVNTGNNVRFGTQGNGDLTALGVVNDNRANFSQLSDSVVNTGRNTANRNIGLEGVDASLTSGDAGISNVFSAAANANTSNILGTGLSGSGSDVLDVTNTGNNVRVNGGSNDRTIVGVLNFNNATFTQRSFSRVNTGDNDANRNIDLSGFGTGIDTGNAGLASAFLAAANWNWTMVGGNASMPGMSAWWML